MVTDSVAMNKNTGTQLDLSVAVIIRSKKHRSLLKKLCYSQLPINRNGPQ